ncbi:hypothetical protein D3C87_2190450 [compost metagenome]
MRTRDKCNLTRAFTTAGLTGLLMKSTAPASKPSTSSVASVSAVTKMTGMPAVATLAFSTRHTS